ncbi:MAG: CHAD domain-containing protein [Immundisolibacter sp.]|uniref:CHAD domain-containing protein n=1 Tax=Immundisolibacter sp. TaxID=1934948 RepID=UPI003D11BE0B
MAFELDLQTPPAQDVPRLLDEQIAAAENALQGTPDADATHAARRHLKRARAMLRLLDADLGGRAATVDAALRTAGRHLSESRDATVLVATIDALLDLRPRPATAKALRSWQAALRSAGETVVEPDALAAARDALQQARQAATGLGANGDTAVWTGFEASYREGRRALRRAQAKPTARRLHTLRKALKHHVYQLRVLRPLWPAVLGAVHDEADRAAELLGLHHDCEVLRERLAGSGLSAARQTRVDALAAVRQGTLAEGALARCALLYAERGGRYARRIAAWAAHPLTASEHGR